MEEEIVEEITEESFNSLISIEYENDRVKLDYESPFEEIFNSAFIFSMIAIVFSIVIFFKEKQISAAYAAGGFTVLSFISWFARKFIDCYWYLDMEKSEIHYYGKYFMLETDFIHGRFRDISGFGVDCSYYSSKHDSYWSYCLLMILKNGKIIRLSDYDRGGYSLKNEEAKKLAEKLNASYFSIPQETRSRKSYDNMKRHYVLTPRTGIWNYIGAMQWSTIILIIIFIYIFSR